MNKYIEELNKIEVNPSHVAALKSNPAFAELITQTKTGDTRLDSLDTSAYYFLRQLEYVKAKVLEVKYPELTARKIFPVDHSTPQGAVRTSYEVTDIIGGAKVQANHANDIKRVDITTHYIDVEIKNVSNFYDYSWRDLRAAQFSNTPLQERKAKASQRDIEEQLNALAWAGDPAFQIKGVLSDGNGITNSPMPGTLRSFTSARDLNTAITDKIAYVHSRSRGAFSPDTLVLPLAEYDYLFDTIWDGTAMVSIGKFLLDNNRHLKRILPAPELMADSGLNRFNAPVGMLFEYNKDNMAIEVPMPPTMRPPHQTLTGVQVLNEAETGGMFIKQPLSALILTGL